MNDENTNTNSNYRVNLEVFEGPLDLLLYLIKKNDLDVYDIPVAFLLEEYMRYLDSLKELDIDLAGDFLLMAAEMAHIKSKLLLPDEDGAGEDEELDPRADLIQRLLEFQRFKGASEQLAERTMLGRDVFVPLAPERVESKSDGPIKGDVYDLVEAFSNMLKKVPNERFHEVAVDRISINDRIYSILDQLETNTTVTLADILPPDDLIIKYDILIAFLALLEMSKLRMITIYQNETFGSIFIQKSMEDVDEAEAMHLVESEITIDKG
jgi:segregation and condensation protein A